jgi:hypothetical protein
MSLPSRLARFTPLSLRLLTAGGDPEPRARRRRQVACPRVDCAGLYTVK